MTASTLVCERAMIETGIISIIRLEDWVVTMINALLTNGELFIIIIGQLCGHISISVIQV